MNWLKQLEEVHLEIHVPRTRLTLLNLKTFKQKNDSRFDDIILDAPQLVNLSAYCTVIFNLVHPQTVKTLEIYPHAGSLFLSENFCEFLPSLAGLKRLLI